MNKIIPCKVCMQKGERVVGHKSGEFCPNSMGSSTLTKSSFVSPSQPTSIDTPRVYVACLSSYNSGALHGVWIDVDEDSSVMQEQVDEMLKSSPYPGEEYAIHDYDNFGKMKISEYTSIDNIAYVGGLLESELDEHEVDPFAAYMDDNHLDFEDMADDGESHIDTFRDSFMGTYDSLEDYVYELVEEGMVSEEVQERYFDWDKAKQVYVDDFNVYMEEEDQENWESAEAYADSMLEDEYNVSELAKTGEYFDISGYSNDIRIEMSVIEDSNGVHIFAP